MKENIKELNIRWLFIAVGIFWTAAILLLLLWNYRQTERAVLAIARTAANESFTKDVLYRQWATMHGGLYVPVSPETPPNPHLAAVAERDITTTSGKKMTLMNPAYMTRQVHELGKKEFRIQAHITSRKPIRPENAADPWEAHALGRFQEGAKEVSAVMVMEGAAYFRFMRPLVTRQSCLKCHAAQGYKVGDIRGGISVSIPWGPYHASMNAQVRAMLAGYGMLWLLGLLGLLGASRLILGHLAKRRKAEKELENSVKEKEILMRELQHRVKNNLNVISSLLSLEMGKIADASAKKVFENARSRVRSMAMIYEGIYQSADFDRLNFGEHLRGFLKKLLDLYVVEKNRVRLTEKIEDVTLDLKRAAPLVLIINELIANALKYAFNDNTSGEIIVALEQRDGTVTLRVEDNGQGMPPGTDPMNTDSMGLTLVRLLTEQMEGKLSFGSGAEGGTAVTVSFTPQP